MSSRKKKKPCQFGVILSLPGAMFVMRSVLDGYIDDSLNGQVESFVHEKEKEEKYIAKMYTCPKPQIIFFIPKFFPL